MRSASPALFVCALACASAPSAARLSTTGAQPATVTLGSTAPAAVRGQIITGSFMSDYYGGETLADVLRRRAPLYLRPRGTPSAELPGRADPIAVYIDGGFSGGLDVLSLIPANTVFSVERISAVDATIRYGGKHNSGALLVKLVRRD
jgi:hypothetical protein